VVSTFSGQQQVNLCYLQGFTDVCPSIMLDSPLPNGNFVNVQAFNLASIYTNGFDIEASYRRPLSGLGLPGTFTIRGLATRVLHYRSTSGIPGTIPTELAGVNLGSTPYWKVLGIQSWDTDKFSLSITERWFSDGVYSREYVECQSNCPLPTANNPTIDNNHMAGAFYVDIGGSYNVTKGLTAYFKVDNLMNKAPEPAPASNVTYGFNPLLYDVLGRTFRAGVRLNF
jgi:outer membrane receptor protein involved in Fe transport